MCRVLGVHRGGYCVWQREATRSRAREDDRLPGLIKHHWLASGGVYGYRKVTVDLRESSEACSRHRVQHRLMNREADSIGLNAKWRDTAAHDARGEWPSYAWSNLHRPVR